MPESAGLPHSGMAAPSKPAERTLWQRMPSLSIHHRFAVSCQAESTESANFDDAAKSKDSPKKHSFFVASSLPRHLTASAIHERSNARHLKLQIPKQIQNPKKQTDALRASVYDLEPRSFRFSDFGFSR
jgi:hypothetical protein